VIVIVLALLTAQKATKNQEYSNGQWLLRAHCAWRMGGVLFAVALLCCCVVCSAFEWITGRWEAFVICCSLFVACRLLLLVHGAMFGMSCQREKV
jgi:hypothetical protein